MILLGHKFPKTDLFQSQNNLHFNSINSEKRLPRKLSEALILLYLLSEGSSARNSHRTTFSLNSRLRTHSVFNDYSITVATRPDPTVRPPSRFSFYIWWSVLICFSLILLGSVYRLLHIILLFQNFLRQIYATLLFTYIFTSRG